MIDMPTRHRPHRFAGLRQEAHVAGHAHAVMSPHIRHEAVRSHVVATLQDVVREVLARRGTCRVLEVGAGHGTVGDHLAAAGAHVVADPDGSGAVVAGGVDVVACLSVLHRIPDHLSAVDGWTRRIAPGGAFVSFQDPLRRPRRSGLSPLGHRARDGVDEMVLVELLAPLFEEVRLESYWSGRGRAAQAVGGLIRSQNTFGIVARDRRIAVPSPRGGAT